MTPRVAILDYGCGNLASVVNAVRKVGGEVEWMTEMHYPAFTHIIIPGQGSFTAGAHLSEATRTNLTSWKQRGVPILGICLGMQLMCESSEEAPGIQGLGWLPYHVERLKAQRLPHIGWNRFSGAWLARLDPGASHAIPMHDYYYCHSYAVLSDATGRSEQAGVEYYHRTRYGDSDFVAQVRCGNLWATQFHPEKSGKAGLELLAQFLAL